MNSALSPLRLRILVAEDDPGMAEVLAYALRESGHEVSLATTGRAAIAAAEFVDFVVLDIGLPDFDGFEVCRQIRKTRSIPILFLTSRSDEIDRVVGLELGADDYVTKPFSLRELQARIKSIQRRLRPPDNVGGLLLDRAAFTASIDSRPLELSRTEFDLLELLSQSPGRVFTRSQILDGAWRDGGCVTDRTVDVHIKTLRKKLAPADPIETVRGVGYRFAS